MIDSVQILHRPDQHDDPQPPQLITLNQPFSPSKELMHQIDARWDKISHQSKRKGRHWYNGKIWSPLSANTQYIQVRHAMFKDFIGTRHLSSNVAPVDRVSTVSVAVLPVEVEDNPNRKIRSINLFRRRKNSLDFGGYFSGLGGLMEPEKDGLNPVSTAIREVKEECGLLTTPDNYVYLGTAITTPEHSVTYCYLLELSKNTIAQGFVFEDAEMTHNIRLPTWILGLLRAKLSPAAPWVKQYAQLIIDQHKHRL